MDSQGMGMALISPLKTSRPITTVPTSTSVSLSPAEECQGPHHRRVRWWEAVLGSVRAETWYCLVCHMPIRHVTNQCNGPFSRIDLRLCNHAFSQTGPGYKHFGEPNPDGWGWRVNQIWHNARERDEGSDFPRSKEMGNGD